MPNNSIQFLKNSIFPDKFPIILFGASRGAQYTLRVLRHLNINVACIVESEHLSSNNLYAAKKVDSILGTAVLSLAEGYKKFPDAQVLITTMDSKSLLTIQSMLKKIGWSNLLWLIPDTINCYLSLFTDRKIDQDKFQSTKLQLFNHTSRYSTSSISPSITILVTEKCNLNCDHCAAFVPQNLNPHTFSAESIFQSVKNYCEAFDFVYRVCIMGGEPFLHKEIISIIDLISTIPNLLFIDFATNGTVVPNSRTLDAVRRAGSCIEVSDYSVASRKMEQLFTDCAELGILYFHQKYSFWGNLGEITDYQRSDAELHTYFMECIQGPGITNHIIDGVLYRCLTSGMARRLAMYPENKNDYLNLLDKNIKSLELHNEIKKFTFRTKPLEACRYCRNGTHQVKAGLQIVRA